MAVPVITAQPTQQSAAVSSTATFSVTASGATSYQWNLGTPPYSVVQTIDYRSSGSASSIVTGSYTLTAGNRVTLWAMWFGSSDTSTACTDTNGNTWSKVSGSAFSDSGAAEYVAWECKNVTVGGVTAITVTLSAASTDRAIAGLEVYGLSPSAAVQVIANNRQVSPGTGTDAVTTGNITPTSQPAMLIALGQNSAFTSALNAGTGFTGYALPNVTNFNGGSTSVIEVKRITSTATTSATFTTGGSAGVTIALGLIVTEAKNPISGATSSSYTTGTLTAANNGTVYSVDCTNTDGTTTSASVYLFIIGESSGDGDKINSAWFFR